MKSTIATLLLSFAVLLTGLSTSLAQQAPASNAVKGPTVAPAPRTPIPTNLPDHFPSLQVLSLRAISEGQHEEFVRVMEKAYDLRPFDYQVMAQLVAGYSLLDEKTKAYNLMLNMQQQGIGFDFNLLPQTENIRPTETYEYINDLMKLADEPYVTSTVNFELPKAAIMPEAISFSSKSKQFYIGTIYEPQIFVLDHNGDPVAGAPKFEEIKYGIFDIAIDEARGILWVSTSAVGQQVSYKPSDFGKNALLKFELDSGKLLDSYTIKPDGQPHGMGNIAVSSEGTVYIADLRTPAIHQLTPDAKQLELLVIIPALPDVRGITLNEDHNLLYLADQNRGIAFIDLADKRPYVAGLQDNVNLGGIEGIDYWQNQLYIIQPGMRPARMIQLLLNDNGRAILAANPLDANHEKFHAPNYGVIADNRYYYMGSSHWTAFTPNGQRLPGSSLAAVSVLSTPLTVMQAEDRLPPTVQEALRRREEQRNTPALLRRPESDETDDGE